MQCNIRNRNPDSDSVSSVTYFGVYQYMLLLYTTPRVLSFVFDLQGDSVYLRKGKVRDLFASTLICEIIFLFIKYLKFVILVKKFAIFVYFSMLPPAWLIFLFVQSLIYKITAFLLLRAGPLAKFLICTIVLIF